MLLLFLYSQRFFHSSNNTTPHLDQQHHILSPRILAYLRRILLSSRATHHRRTIISTDQSYTHLKVWPTIITLLQVAFRDVIPASLTAVIPRSEAIITLTSVTTHTHIMPLILHLYISPPATSATRPHLSPLEVARKGEKTARREVARARRRARWKTTREVYKAKAIAEFSKAKVKARVTLIRAKRALNRL
jgi:hypothetical protein